MPVFAGNDIDSLMQLLDKSSDNQKSTLLNQLSLEYLNVSPETSIDYAYRSLVLAQKHDNYPDMAGALKTIASFNYRYGSIDSAIYYNRLALEIYQKLGDSTGISKVLNNLGIFYNELGDYENAIAYHLKSLQIKQNLKDSSGIAYSSNNIGALYYQLDKYETALEYFKKALRISQSINDKNSEQSALSNIGLIYFNLRLYDKAIEAFRQSNEINNLLNNIRNMSNNLVLIANVYFEKGMLNDALEYYLRSQNLNESYGIKEPETLFTIAALFDSLKEYENSIRYYSRAMDIAQLTNEKDILLKAGKSISIDYSLLGNWQQAYESLLIYQQLKDSLQEYKTNYQKRDTINSFSQKYAENIDTSGVNDDSISSSLPVQNNDFLIIDNKIILGIAALLFLALVILVIYCRKRK